MVQSKRISTIDCLRGLAAISVCYYHLTSGNAHYLPSNSFIKKIGVHGYLGVEIFFIISGFILLLSLYESKYSLKNYFTFILKRLTRIDIPYFAIIIVCILLGYLSTLSPLYKGIPFSIDYVNLALHIGYLTSIMNKSWINPVFWTLALEFQFYLSIALLYPLLINKKISFYIFIALSLITSYFAQTNDFLFKYLPFFCLGIVLFKYYKKLISFKVFLILSSCIFLFILFRFNYQHFIASAIPLILFYKDDISNKLFLFLGKISYSIYLLHVPFGMRIINLADSLATNYRLKEFIVFIDLLIIVGISFLFYRFVEKPAVRLSRKFVYKH